MSCSALMQARVCMAQTTWSDPVHQLCDAEEVQSMLAASGAPLVERYTHQHSMLMLEAALEKARRSHRPLIITSLPGPSDDPTQIHMDPSLLKALDMQVWHASLYPCSLAAKYP